MSNLTQVNAQKITEFLGSDAKRAEEIFALSAEEALVKINGGTGHVFTVEELRAYRSAVSNLSDDALAGVAGGAGADASEDSFLGSLAAGLIVAAVSSRW